MESDPVTAQAPTPQAPTPQLEQYNCLRCKCKINNEVKASKFDPAYCVHCMADIQVLDDTFTRTETEYNKKKDVMTVITSKCRQISFAGADWVWHSKRIAELTDDELKSQFEYHRATVAQMELEIMTRNVKKAHQNYGLPGQHSSISVTRVSEVKKSKITKVEKSVNLTSLGIALQKLHLTPEQISQLFAGVGK
jgi:hypothetical protein